jgi:hypothetical protein
MGKSPDTPAFYVASTTEKRVLTNLSKRNPQRARAVPTGDPQRVRAVPAGDHPEAHGQLGTFYV